MVGSTRSELKNKIGFFIDQGNAEILPWGETEWTKAYDGQLVLEGDLLSIDQSSRGVLQFYNGTLVRIDADAKMEIDEIVTDGDGDQVNLDLSNGRIWLNMNSNTDDLLFVVETDNLRVTSYGTVFEVSLTDRETVRVLEGEALVEILEPDSDNGVVLEQVKVGVGQQVELTANDLETMVARQPVSLLEAIDDDWKTSDWYDWNMNLDTNPEVYEVDESLVIEETEEDTEEAVGETTEETEEEEVEEVEEEDTEATVRPALTLTFPEENPYTLPAGDDFISIKGTATESTETIIVVSYDADANPYYYNLGQYTPGASTWQYNAAWAYGNLREGRNLFTIYGTDASGLLESDPIDVIVEVSDGAFAAFEEEAAEDSTDETTDGEETTDETVVGEDAVIEETEASVVDESETSS
ncbi:MAG: FecR domain-containing protein [Candidatus Peregrinibacteria bacterium]|nr:FecR domain-containing protein [Candidatus Peregrinibacteria bacterium]